MPFHEKNVLRLDGKWKTIIFYNSMILKFNILTHRTLLNFTVGTVVLETYGIWVKHWGLSRCSSVRGSSTRFSLVSLTKFEACKSVMFT